jgi:hypothetical protein
MHPLIQARHSRPLDIYRLVDEVMSEVKDSIVIGFDKPLPDGTPEVHVILFVLMADGCELSEELVKTVSLIIDCTINRLRTY